MEDLQIDLELENQEMKELSDLLNDTTASTSGQASQIMPTTAATTAATPSTTPTAEETNQEIDFKQFLTSQEASVLKNLTMALKNIGIKLELGNGIIQDYISIANLKEQHKTMILEVLSKNCNLIYIKDLNNYFRPASRPNKRKLDGSNKQEKLEKLPRFGSLNKG